MKNFIIGLLVVLVVIFGISLFTKPKVYKEKVQVHHLKDGRYTYAQHYKKQVPNSTYSSPTDDWIIWYILFGNNGSTYTNYTNNYTSGGSFSPPRGTTWVQSLPANSSSDKNLVAPNEEEVQASETMTEEVVVTSEGIPAVDAEGNLVDPTDIAPSFETVTESSSIDAPSAESSPDTGGDGGGAD